MWCFRSMQRIQWLDRVTNYRVLQQVNEQRTMIPTIKTRTKQYLRHTLRHESAIRDILEGVIPEKGKRKTWTNCIS